MLDAALALFRYVQVGTVGWVLGAGCRQGQGRVWGMWCAVHALALRAWVLIPPPVSATNKAVDS